MKTVAILALAAGIGLLPVMASGQAASPNPAPAYDRAPWWMRDSTLAQVGYVRTEVPANRAGFSASFLAVDQDLAAAQGQAIARVRLLQQALAKLGADKVAVSIDFNQRPLYEQYRDKNGSKVSLGRSDKINGYEVSAQVYVDVRDISRLEYAYALVMAAAPNEVDTVAYELAPNADDQDWLYGEAVSDAGERAAAVTAASGATLGAVQAVDPKGRACQGDIVARKAGGYDGALVAQPVTWRRPAAVTPFTPPAASGPEPAPDTVEALEARARRTPFIQTPPLLPLEARTCIVYGLK